MVRSIKVCIPAEIATRTNLSATPEEYARALYGNNSNSSAVAMVAGTQALTSLIASVDSGKMITESTIKDAHRPGLSEYDLTSKEGNNKSSRANYLVPSR